MLYIQAHEFFDKNKIYIINVKSSCGSVEKRWVYEGMQNFIMKSADKGKNEFISLPMGSNGAEVVFFSVEELSAWIAEERSAWSWVDSIEQRSYQPIANEILYAVIGQLADALDKLVPLWESDNFAETLHNIDELKQFFRSVEIPFSSTALGKYILSVSDESQLTAVYMLYLSSLPKDGVLQTSHGHKFFTKYSQVMSGNVRDTKFPQIMSSEPYRLEASRRLLMFQGDNAESAALSYKASMDEYLNDVIKIRNDAAKSLKDFEGWQEIIQLQVNEWLTSSQERYKAFVRKFFRRIMRKGRRVNQALQNTATNAVDELEASKNAYSSQVEFSETVGYWEAKQVGHGTAKFRWFLSLCGGGVFVFLVPLIISLIPNAYFGEANLVFGIYHPGKLLLTLLAISIGSYAVRFCSKQYSSQQHLYLEAVERQTMLKTYIGLMLNGKLNEQEDRKSALDTLFRPAQTGVVTDHGAVMPSDTVIKVFDKHMKN